MSTTLFEAKAQHYIPKFYLKGFTDKCGVLWVYERFKPLRKSKPKKEAHRPDYYNHTEKEGRDETAEDILKDVESEVAPIIRKLANFQYNLKPEDAANLIVFVSFMFARVPSWREYLDSFLGQMVKQKHLEIAGDREKFYKSCADFESKNGKPLGMDWEELRQEVLKGDFDIEQKSRAYNLRQMFGSGVTVAETLRHFGYEALYAPEGTFFMTSDSPVYTLQPDGKGQATVGMGFASPGVEVYFPLNKRACLRMKHGIQPSRRLVYTDHVDQINRLIMATATRHLYSCECYKRTARLFDERGCKVRPGKESFLSAPSASPQRLRTS